MTSAQLFLRYALGCLTYTTHFWKYKPRFQELGLFTQGLETILKAFAFPKSQYLKLKACFTLIFQHLSKLPSPQIAKFTKSSSRCGMLLPQNELKRPS